MRRRGLAERRVNKRVDEKLAEKRATHIAMGKADALRIIDDYIRGFEQALIENRVRMDNPSDFNLMLRLKEFLDGGADSRSEVQAMFTLEDLQQRHRRMLRDLDRQRAATDAAALDGCRRDTLVEGDQESVTNSPDRGSSDRSQELTAHFGSDANDVEREPDDRDEDGDGATADLG